MTMKGASNLLTFLQSRDFYAICMLILVRQESAKKFGQGPSVQRNLSVIESYIIK